jgi:cytochrome c oxidase subunit II
VLPQSTLEPAGRDAERIADLFWWMAAGGGLIWIAIIALSIYILHYKPGTPYREGAARTLILGGGVIVPTIVLAVLLAYGLSLLPRILALPPEGALVISVTGEQWWWRVRYLLPDGATVDLANELRLPVGQRVEVRLGSPDVIHAFWVPALAGKMDAIPGRVNRIALEPTRAGVFRGACAEYCGASHARMAFDVVVTERAAFEEWLRSQAAASAQPNTAWLQRGRDTFLANGCGACHTVRGTMADGVTAPDLTHVGSRLSLAAGTLANDRGGFFRWIFDSHRYKPEARMPAFGMLPPDDLLALADYMDSLQ